MKICARVGILESYLFQRPSRKPTTATCGRQYSGLWTFLLLKPPKLLSALLFSDALFGIMRTLLNPSFLLARFTVKRYSSHDVGSLQALPTPRAFLGGKTNISIFPVSPALFVFPMYLGNSRGQPFIYFFYFLLVQFQ
jgi:hypothetical protein